MGSLPALARILMRMHRNCARCSIAWRRKRDLHITGWVRDLARLAANAALLEVGGVVFLLSCQLAAEGFAITAIEPTYGFGEFRHLGDIMLELAAVKPTIAPCKAEDLHLR